MGRWMRNMRTTQELRVIERDLRDGVPVRRRRRNLPTAWDDFWRSTQRSWKEQRKTHFKLRTE